MSIRVAELFAGIGGFRVGFDDANKELGQDAFDTVWSNQWEPDGREPKQFAWRCYETHFGKGSCVNEDITRVLDEVTDGTRTIPEYDLLCGGFPCFTAGHLVITRDGPVPIEDIRKGDYVLTHLGRYRKVLGTGSHMVSTVTLHGTDRTLVTCTSNHPFYASDEDGNETWTSAEDMVGKKWLFPSVRQDDDETPQIPPSPQRDEKPIDVSSLLFLAGFWLGGGVNDTKNDITRLYVRVGDDDEEERYATVLWSAHNSGFDYEAEMLKAQKHHDYVLISINGISDWIGGQFYSDDRRHIPEWVFQLDYEERQAFYNGYVLSKAEIGSIRERGNRLIGTVTTSDRSVMLDIRRLAHSIGLRTSLTDWSQGMEALVIREQEADEKSDEAVDGADVIRPKGVWQDCVSLTEGPTTIVYNMEVDEDNSYTVNGIAVHNCQSFSVARPRSSSVGLDDVPGGKGTLWWQIDRILRIYHPKYGLFENVDRILKTPTSNRGRDFATILSSLIDNGYDACWHIVNAADYGNPQKRKRMFLLCVRHDEACRLLDDVTADGILHDGIMARALPVTYDEDAVDHISLTPDVQSAFSSGWSLKSGRSPFLDIGAVTIDGDCVTAKAIADYHGEHRTLADVLVPISEVPEGYFVSDEDYPRWEATRQAKRIPRTSKDGHEYVYSEGAMSCPDPTDRPARTILTGSGGASPSRMKHIIATGNDGTNKRYRRLVPDELDALQGFPKGWTNTGMSDAQRTFCAGNALVTDIPRRIGMSLAMRIQGQDMKIGGNTQ